jgi:hypothetical protein
MSWDVLIMNTGGRTRVDDLPEGFQPESLGDADELRSLLSGFFGSLDWSDPAWGILDNDEFSFEFNFTESGPVDTFMLLVRGGGDAVAPIVAMCKQFGWQALDCSAGEFIDLNHPSTNGWEGFQAYRDRVMKESTKPPKPWWQFWT